MLPGMTITAGIGGMTTGSSKSSGVSSMSLLHLEDWRVELGQHRRQVERATLIVEVRILREGAVERDLAHRRVEGGAEGELGARLPRG